MQKYSYLFILLWVFVGCAPDKPKAPSDLLTQSQMSGIIADMHIADAITTSKALLPDSANQEAISYREFILKKHNTNKQQFTASLEFYKQNPEQLDSVYAEVITKLSSTETQYLGK